MEGKDSLSVLLVELWVEFFFFFTSFCVFREQLEAVVCLICNNPTEAAKRSGHIHKEMALLALCPLVTSVCSQAISAVLGGCSSALNMTLLMSTS